VLCLTAWHRAKEQLGMYVKYAHAHILEQIPEALKAQVKELGDAGADPERLPMDAASVEEALAIVREHGRLLKYLPEAFKTAEVCRAAEDDDDGDDEEPGADDWFNRGNAFISIQKDYDSAIDAYLKSLSMEPENCTVLNSLAYSYLGKQDYEEAIEAVSKAIALEPEDAEYWDSRAEIHEAAGNYAKAAADARKALKLDPDKESSQEILDRCTEKLEEDDVL
jgi:tetratricopeptide (TPR) repeat protein